jgi:hypothetical protein
MPAIIDLLSAIAWGGGQAMCQLRVHAGVGHQPAADLGRGLGPSSSSQGGQRPAMPRPRGGEHFELVVSRQHDIQGLRRHSGRLEVGLRDCAAVQEVPHLDDPEPGATAATGIQGAYRGQNGSKEVWPGMDIPDDDLDHRACASTSPT